MTDTRARYIRFVGIALLALVVLLSTKVLAAPYGSRTMYSGTFGTDVVELQRRLTSLGYEPGKADGVFGARTRDALLRFQRDYGLVPDGQAGKWTLQSVDRAYTWQHGFSYTVRPGDSLWSISVRYGTKVDSLVWLNRLQDTMVYPGQVVRIGGDARNLPPTAQNPPPPPPPVLPPPLQSASAPPGSSGNAPANTPAPGYVPVPQRQYLVLGYYAEDWETDTRALASLRNSRGQVDLVVNFNLLIDARGNLSTRAYPDLMAEARKQGIKVQGLVHNHGANGFDAGVARAVLSDPTVRARAVENMVAVARQHSLSGINIDIENVPPDQRSNYTALVRELSQRFKREGLTLTLSIPAKTFDDTKSSWSGAFDYKALGQYADYIVPMAYDEHLPGFSAGPIASVGWVDKVAAFAVSQIPREKVLLGVPAYAYDWRRGTTEGRGMSAPQAANLAARHGAAIQWDSRAQVPYFTYVNNGQERIVYYENARSLAFKLEIVRKYNLAGIGIWRMGLEDPGIWSAIEKGLR